MKKKRKRTCHVANTSKEPTSPLEVAWWGSKYHEALLWALRTGRRRRRRRRRRWWKRGPSSFSHICILTNHTHTHTHTHTRTFLSFTTCTVQLQGSFSLSQTTQPNKHIQLHLLLARLPLQQQVEVPQLTPRSPRLPLGKVHKPPQAVWHYQ